MKLNAKNYTKKALGYLTAISLGVLATPVSLYSNGEAPGCPNNGPGPPNPCPDGTCCEEPPPPPGGGGGGPAPGGGGGPGDRKTNASFIGDPINISTGSSLSMNKDVSIPVKYGLSLDIGRRYSSEIFDTLNSDGDTMFGPHWHGNYEMRLKSYQYGDPITDFYSFLDSDGAKCDFQYMFQEYDADFGANVKVFRAFAQQGEPKELRFKVTNPDQYVITRSNHSQAIFDSDLKLIALEANKDTVAQERITFVYDTNDRMIEVHSPTGDDRYLEIEYHDDTLNDVIDQVKTVSLVTSTSSVELVEYGYLANSRLLSYMERPEANNDYRVIYEYGNFDGSDLNTITGYEYLLGRVSYRSDSQVHPLNAYGYADFPMYWGSSSKKAYRCYNYDPDNSQWVNIVEVDYNSDWYNLEVIYPCDLVDQPKSLDTLDWQHDLLIRSYENLDSYQSPVASALISQLEAVGRGGGDEAAAMAPPPSYGTAMAAGQKQTPPGADVTVNNEPVAPRVPSGVNLWDPNTQDYTIEPTKIEYDLADPYSATDSKYLYQFYKTDVTKYTTTDSSSALTTEYEYSTTFPYRATEITNPENGATVYTYGTNTSNTASYGQITSILEPDGDLMVYYYNSFGLVDQISENGVDTYYEYNTRGQLTRIEREDGSIISKTFNDFGQALTATDEITSQTVTYTYSDQLLTTDSQYHVPPRLIKVTDNDNNDITYEYNDWGQVISTMDQKRVLRNSIALVFEGILFLSRDPSPQAS